MIRDSQKYTDSKTGLKLNAIGKSDNFWGDFFKLGGARHFEGADWAVESQDKNASAMGRLQGTKGWIKTPFFTYNYEAGSFGDNLVEAYAGPHDFFNSFWFYNQNGNNIPYKDLSWFARHFGNAINFFDVLPATSFAVAAAYSNYSYVDPTAALWKKD